MQRILRVTHDDGRVTEKAVPGNAIIVTPQNIATVVGDESGMPLAGETLAAIIAAASRRLAERNRHLEG